MNNALKKELALITGLYTLLGAPSRSGRKTALLAAAAGGLYLASLRPQFKFIGKNVYLTGGSRGLGLSLAWNLLLRGANVTLVARDEKELFDAKTILKASFPRAKVFINICDVTDSRQLQESLDETIQRMGHIDLLINNAGAISVGPFTSMSREDFEAAMKLHLFAPLEATQLLFAHFKTRGGGRILNICSLGGKIAIPHMLPYNVSKFAMAGFAQGATAELAPHGIRMTTVYPTVLRTGSPIQAVFKGDHDKEMAWFATLDNLPGLSMSADRAAKKILDAVADGRSELVLSAPAKARLMLGALFPETMNMLMSFAMNFLPKRDSAIRKTGSQSLKIFSKSKILAPFAEKAESTERMYNQVARNDASFNMGLSTKR